MKTENVFRQCSITRKKLPRSDLFRIVKTKDGKIFFDPAYKIPGRGIHVVKEKKILEKFFDPRKQKMIQHFLKSNISREKMEEIFTEVKKNF